MEKKQFDLDDLNNALDEFDNQELNLTGEEPNPNVDEDPQTVAKIKEEYDKFMQEMKNIGMNAGGQEQGLDNFANILGGLLKNLASQSGLEDSEGQLTKGFEQMFKNLKEDNVQQVAGQLLNKFMDKNLLYQPLQEAKQHYDEFFKKQQGKLTKENQQRYRKQYELLNQILSLLDNNPEQKQKLIDLFEKMQELGSPPEGITSTTSFM